MKKKKILLIITGSIASYKALTLIRLIKNSNIDLSCILTKSAEKFVTPLSVSALTGEKVYSSLFNLDDEMEMGHIKLAKENDLIVVAPASANFLSKVSNGFADDLASTVLLATKSKTLFFPAMNTNMLNNYLIQKNINNLKKAGFDIFDTNSGDLACGEVGEGRFKEPEEIFSIIKEFIFKKEKIFRGLNALVTAGPTQELVDPIRYISNFSSGKQGYAFAKSLADMGANVCLVSGPTNIKKPDNIKKFIAVQTADQMLKACTKNIPSDIFISVAAVADWKLKEYQKNKIKKSKKSLSFKFEENIDIVKYISKHNKRPKLVVGFAAETNNLKKNAIHKLKEKNCDLIIANEISKKNSVIGGDMNSVYIYDNYKCLQKYLNMKKDVLSEKVLIDIIHPLILKINATSNKLNKVISSNG